MFLSKIEAQYANPSEILFQEVVLLDISPRMSAMTQRMTYESWQVMSGTADPKSVEKLYQQYSERV
ncbi:MAG: hypothetical protein AAFU41_18235 [Pseudomonadota bacterium]